VQNKIFFFLDTLRYFPTLEYQERSTLNSLKKILNKPETSCFKVFGKTSLDSDRNRKVKTEILSPKRQTLPMLHVFYGRDVTIK